MKAQTVVMLIALGMVFLPSHAEPSIEFGYQILPEKLLENTEGVIQLYVSANGIMVPESINNLKVISSDNSIIKVIGVEQFNDYITNIKIQALNPGNTKLAVAASGFLSKEIPIQVYNNNNFPTQIMMKITPNDFPVDGPKFGYISVEILTTAGLPTKVENDIIVSISTPNIDVIELDETELVIQKGNYFAVGKFTVKASGDATIFAEVEGMKKTSGQVHVRNANVPLTIQLYVAPTNFNSFSTSKGYAIAQLEDAAGIPVNAEKDILVSLEVENPDAKVNTSRDFDEILFSSKKIVIKEGTYSAYTSFTPRPNLADFTDADSQTFNMYISAEDYLTGGTTITIDHQEIGLLEGEGPAKMLSLPFFTTGKEELIGVMYFEAILSEVSEGSVTNLDVAVPVMAKHDLEINVASSDLSTVKTKPAFFSHGGNAALVFGKTGTMVSPTALEFYVTDNQGVKITMGKPYGPVEDDLALIVDSLVPMILADEDFPILAYLEESEEGEESSGEEEDEENGRMGVTHFTEDTVITVSADEFVDVEPEVVKQNQAYAFMMAKSKKLGTTSLTVYGSGFEQVLTVTSHTTDPTTIFLSYPEITLPNTKNVVAIQFLDSAGNPVYAKEDIQINLVSSDESVIKIPISITIPKDDYYTFFEINMGEEGLTEVSALVEDLTLAKFDLEVKGLNPQISLDAINSININEQIEAKLNVVYPNLPLSSEGLEVEWVVSGADIIQKDSVTNENGVAVINVVGHDPGEVEIKAFVNGLGISNTEVSKKIAIETPILLTTESETVDESAFNFDNTRMVYIIIPIAAAAALIFLKRTNRLEQISERLNLGDLNLGERILEIKEKVLKK